MPRPPTRPGSWFLLVATALWAAACGGVATVDLERAAAGRLPFRAAYDRLGETIVSLDGGWGQPYLGARIDGVDAVFSARNPGIVRQDEGPTAYGARWQYSLPPAYCHRTPCASLEGLWDVDGDGRAELVLISPTADRRLWLVCALDADTGTVVAEFTLAGGPERRQDGVWDGVYSVVGTTLAPTPGGPRRGLIVAASTGFDWAPRGVMAVDALSGEVLWTHWAGARPGTRAVRAIDLDGDGVTDSAYLGVAVGNLPGPVNGLQDDECAVVAVGADGSRRWVSKLGGLEGGSLEAVRTPAGSLVLAATGGTRGRDARLVVLDGATGSVRAEARLPGPPRGIVAMVDAEGVDVFVGVDHAGLHRYRFDGRLVLAAAAKHPGRLRPHALVELLPGRGQQLLVGDGNGEVFVLGRDLRPLAHLATPPAPVAAGGMALVPRRGREPTLLVLGTELALGFTLEILPNPRPIPWSALALLPAAAGAAWYVRRRRRGTSAATRRELRLQLLGRLELSGHGAIGALRSLRRLVWLLDARAQAAATSSGLDARLAGLLGECRDHMLPDLAGTLELAGLAGCGAAVTGQARGAHERLARLLDTAGTDPAVDQELREAAALLEGAMRSLRREVEDDFRTDLAAVAARVLDAHAEAAAAAGVTVATAGLDAPLWCRGDADELVFVLDNLVENALRAMAGSARRELTLRARREDSLILLQVQDTGCGIAPDDWEPVLETRMSTREGGGLGLPESRRRLRKHGGSLAVTASRAGAGTTLTLSVVPARAREGT